MVITVMMIACIIHGQYLNGDGTKESHICEALLYIFEEKCVLLLKLVASYMRYNVKHIAANGVELHELVHQCTLR